MKYTKKQIQESIKYWQNQLKLGNYINEAGDWQADLDKAYDKMRSQKTPRTRRQMDLSDKRSVTQCFIKHNDELTEFVEKTPKPTKDELISFVLQILAEDGLITLVDAAAHEYKTTSSWIHEFIQKMKIYCKNMLDVERYIWSARLKGQGLGVIREDEETEDSTGK